MGTSLVIGMVLFATMIVVGDLLANAMQSRPVGGVLRERPLIGGWLAMWRRLEVFLYGWWPIRAKARLYDRLSAMPLRLCYREESHADAWRQDWPAVNPSTGTAVSQTPTPAGCDAAARDADARSRP